MNQLQMARHSAVASVFRKHSLKRRFCGQQVSHPLPALHVAVRPIVSSLSSSSFGYQREKIYYQFPSRKSPSSDIISINAGPSLHLVLSRRTTTNRFGRWFSTTSTAVAVDEERDDETDSDEEGFDPNNEEEALRQEIKENFDPNNEQHVAWKEKVERRRAARKEARRITAKRRTASQQIPQWLMHDPFCFQHTMEALNLNLSSSRRKKGGDASIAMSDFPGQYRKLFDDSIQPFVHSLQTSDNLPADVEQALDRLANAGFADSKFARSFRSVGRNRFVLSRATAELEKNIRTYEKRQATVREISEVILDLEREREELEKEMEEYENRNPKDGKKQEDGINSFISRITAAAQMSTEKVTAADKAKSVQDEAEPGYELTPEQKMRRLKRKIVGRKKHIELHEQASQNALEAIEMLKRKQQELESPMSPEEYERTKHVINEALPAISSALSDYIQQRHSKLIGRYQDLDSKTDLTKPQEWYPMARLDKRKIIYHGGPTNSGKTYNALQRLKSAKRGLYVGPLRLLAAEIYETLNAQGVYTSLITGQERREFPFSTHVAATVEMAANLLEEEFDVVVIDEIQMIENKERGFAWTRALLGLRCKEIHVCGGLEAKGLIEKIASACGDDFELNTYDRFGALNVAEKSLATHPDQTGSFKGVRAGDCIVAFSRNDIFAIKREIERDTGYKCCVIYGSLPPDTRTSMAQLFNDPRSGYDILIASDAISMGLNLNIRRIIFNSIFKNDGSDIVRLNHSSVKQIAGRAGRRNSPFPEGEVTTRDPRDLEYVTKCLATEIEPIEKAGLIFTASHVGMFEEAVKSYYSGHDDETSENERETPDLHWLLQEFSDMAVVKGDYFLCKQDDMNVIARWLKDVDLETSDKYMFCMAPISLQNPKARDVLVKYGQKLAAGEVPGLTRSTPMKRAKNFNDLALLCSIYSEVELFIWLQNKFPPVNLMEQQAALAKRDMATNLISLGLDEAERLKLDHCHIQRDARLRMVWTQAQEKIADDIEVNDRDDDDEDGEGEGFYA